MKENLFLSNMHYDVFKDDDHLQLTLVILIAKERSLKEIMTNVELDGIKKITIYSSTIM